MTTSFADWGILFSVYCQRVVWKDVTSEVEPGTWDNQILQGLNPNVFQMSRWADFRRGFGWSPRFLSHSTGAKLLVLHKKRTALLNMYWAPGGPVFTDSSREKIEKVMEDLGSYVEGLPGVQFWRVKPHLPVNSDQVFKFSNWTRPLVPLTSASTVLVPICKTEEEQLAQMTQKHRHTLRKSLEVPVVWEWVSGQQGIASFMQLFNEMENVKGLSHIGIREGDLVGLQKTFKEQFLILIGKSAGRPAVGCVCLATKPQAFYYFAATGALGRENGLSYAMLVHLFKKLRELGVSNLDLGGVDLNDPRTKGVVHFKKGFSDSVTTYLGEWELLRPRLLRPLIDGLIKIRRRRL